MMRLNKLGLLLLGLALAFGLMACGNDDKSAEKSGTITSAKSAPFPIGIPTGTELTQAQTLYNDHCAECHGENGEGEQPDPYAPGKAPPHDPTGHTWHHPDQVNLNTVLVGGVNMPAFGDKLSHPEAMLILGYIKTWWGEDELTVQRQRTEAFVESP